MRNGDELRRTQARTQSGRKEKPERSFFNMSGWFMRVLRTYGFNENECRKIATMSSVEKMGFCRCIPTILYAENWLNEQKRAEMLKVADDILKGEK